MINIGIVGTKGAGKSDLAQYLDENLKGFGKIEIVDNYTEEIANESNLALEGAADYIGNLYVILGRWAKERQIETREDVDTIITCGTMIESATYATVNAVQGASPYHLARIEKFMHLLGVFFQDTFRYDLMLYLPLEDPDSELSTGKVDQLLPTCLNSFGIPYNRLDGTKEEKQSKALELCNETLTKKQSESTPPE